jgi:hypothetical protein
MEFTLFVEVTSVTYSFYYKIIAYQAYTWYFHSKSYLLNILNYVCLYNLGMLYISVVCVCVYILYLPSSYTYFHVNVCCFIKILNKEGKQAKKVYTNM